MKKRFWATDWFAGLAVTLVFVLASGSALLQGLERSAYDLGVRGSQRTPSDRVAVIAIDDDSIAKLGRWPWPRDVHAQIIDVLKRAGAKVIGETVFFLEPQIDPGLIHIEALADFFHTSSLSAAPEALTRLAEAAARDPQLAALAAAAGLPDKLPADINQLGEELINAAIDLDTDAKLADSLANAGNVIVAMPFILGEPRGNPDSELPDYVVANALPNVVDRIGAASANLFPLPALAAITPIEPVGVTAAAIGHLNANPDVDGAYRSEPLVVRYYDAYYPSLSLQIAAHSLNLKIDDIQVQLGEGVQLGRLVIATDSALRMNTFFYADRDGRPAFPVYSFFDVLNGRIPAQVFADKIVLIGATATGVGTPQVTPINANMAPVLTLAHSVSSILEEDFFTQPVWARWAEWGALLLVAAYLIVLLPRLKAGLGAGITIALLAVLLGTSYGLLVSEAMWLKLALPATLLVVGHALLTTKRFLVTERGKEKSEAESAESNRMLGLAYQGKGDLDMAFACFRRVPVDDSLLDLIYNLALDFERKRQFAKAGSAYGYIAEHNPKFRDVETRMSRSKRMEDTVLLGSAGVGGAQATMLLEGSGDMQKPMLGRYEVEKELGKGAMGVVYLGRDPKINRVVAIKTMALSQEFDAEELDEVKERFFREAETAGRLNHPNIVTIYDAGEEHDLAYIAMEFLKGKDLAEFTKKDKLLPLPKVIDIVIKAADALDYAHAQNVVHRDIKPANIMYEVENGNVKLTDFGIARITDASKTKTGMVLGTPSYMSPEQIAGKKVDGRSDLFSLGVMLYQLCTGSLPFTGDSMATLMFKIANEPYPDPLSRRPDLPPELKPIIDKALQKSPDDRYSRGAEMVRDLRAVQAQLGS